MKGVIRRNAPEFPPETRRASEDQAHRPSRVPIVSPARGELQARQRELETEQPLHTGPRGLATNSFLERTLSVGLQVKPPGRRDLAEGTFGAAGLLSLRPLVHQASLGASWRNESTELGPTLYTSSSVSSSEPLHK